MVPPLLVLVGNDDDDDDGVSVNQKLRHDRLRSKKVLRMKTKTCTSRLQNRHSKDSVDCVIAIYNSQEIVICEDASSQSYDGNRDLRSQATSTTEYNIQSF
jgi:hypothetical protein